MVPTRVRTVLHSVWTYQNEGWTKKGSNSEQFCDKQDSWWPLPVTAVSSRHFQAFTQQGQVKWPGAFTVWQFKSQGVIYGEALFSFCFGLSFQQIFNSGQLWVITLQVNICFHSWGGRSLREYTAQVSIWVHLVVESMAGNKYCSRFSVHSCSLQ